MNITFTLEELQRFNDNGTLESHILSAGLLPLNVLSFVLRENTVASELLEEELTRVETENTRLQEAVEDLNDQLLELQVTIK